MEEMKDRLKLLRKALNLKQREIAEKLCVNVSLVGIWESGVNPIPSTRIYQICNEYKVRREWLERGEGDMFQPEAAPKTRETILTEAFELLYEELSEVGKQAVRNLLEREVRRQSRQG